MSAKTIVVEPLETSSGMYVQVRIGLRPMGTMERTDAGYIPVGCRKAIPNIEDAARSVVWRHIQRLLKEAADLSAIWRDSVVESPQPAPTAATPPAQTEKTK